MTPKFHLGSPILANLSKAEVSVNLCACYLEHLVLTLVSLSLVSRCYLMVLQSDVVFELQLLVDLIGHCGILKGVNIYFFLFSYIFYASISLMKENNHKQETQWMWY